MVLMNRHLQGEMGGGTNLTNEKQSIYCVIQCVYTVYIGGCGNE